MSHYARGAGIAHRGHNSTEGKQRWDGRSGKQASGHTVGKKMHRFLCTFWSHLICVNAMDGFICLCIHNKRVVIIPPCGRMNQFNSTEVNPVQNTCKNPILILLLFSHINSHSVPAYEQINCWSLNQATIYKLWKRKKIFFCLQWATWILSPESLLCFGILFG